MDEVTVRPGERHHHCLPGPRSRQRGYGGRAWRMLQPLMVVVVGGRRLCGTWSVSISCIRLAGASRTTVDIVTILLKISSLHTPLSSKPLDI